jgi:hypothetical protein
MSRETPLEQARDVLRQAESVTETRPVKTEPVKTAPLVKTPVKTEAHAVKTGFDKKAWMKTYMREYMRQRRAEAKAARTVAASS